MTEIASPLLTPVVKKDYDTSFSKKSVSEVNTDETPVESNDTSTEQVVENKPEPKQVQLPNSNNTQDTASPTPSYDSDIKDFSFDDDEEDFDYGEGDSQDVSTIEGGEDDDAWEGADDTAGFVCDIVENVVPELCHSKTKLNEGSFQVLEDNGRISVGSTDYIRSINKNNKKAFNSAVKDKRKLIEKPLKQVLEKKGGSLTPEARLGIGVFVLVATLIYTFMDVKKENNELRNRLLKLNNIND